MGFHQFVYLFTLVWNGVGKYQKGVFMLSLQRDSYDILALVFNEFLRVLANHRGGSSSVYPLMWWHRAMHFILIALVNFRAEERRESKCSLVNKSYWNNFIYFKCQSYHQDEFRWERNSQKSSKNNKTPKY